MARKRTSETTTNDDAAAVATEGTGHVWLRYIGVYSDGVNHHGGVSRRVRHGQPVPFPKPQPVPAAVAAEMIATGEFEAIDEPAQESETPNNTMPAAAESDIE